MQKQNKTTPPLRFRDFSDQWEEKQLGEIVDVVRGERVVKKDLTDIGLYPVISGGIYPLGYIDRQNREANTITVAQYGTAGYSDMQRHPFWANDVCYCLSPLQNIDNEFVYQFLKKSQEYIYSLRTNAIPAHLPRERLNGINIKIPSLAEQEKIGAFFKELDELIGAKEEELEKLRQMKAAFLDAMFPTHDASESNGGGTTY